MKKLFAALVCALVAALAHGAEHGFAIADDVVGIGHRRVDRQIGQEGLEAPLAFELRQPRDVLTVELEQVEGVEHHRRLAVEAVFE